MFNTKTAMISLMALGVAAPAFAQPSAYPQPYRDPTAETAYQRQMEDYNRQQNTYQNQRENYDARRDAYADQSADYQRQRDQYLRDKADYDRRYGAGAYDRRYPEYATRYAAAPAPAWQGDGYADQSDDYHRQRDQYLRDKADYDRRYGSGAYDRRYPDYATRYASVAPAAWERDRNAYYRARDAYDRRNGRGAYDRRYPAYAQRFASAPMSQWERERDDYYRLRAEYDRRNGIGAYDRRYPSFASRYAVNAAATAPAPVYAQPCDLQQQQRTNSTAGGIIGALAGAALGGSVAGNGAKTEGAVLGGVVGAVVGASVGRATAKCDSTGYYYSYDQTMPYREDPADRARRSGQYDYSYYERQGCRLVTAPAEINGRTDDRYVRVCPDNQGRYRITG